MVLKEFAKYCEVLERQNNGFKVTLSAIKFYSHKFMVTKLVTT